MGILPSDEPDRKGLLREFRFRSDFVVLSCLLLLTFFWGGGEAGSLACWSSKEHSAHQGSKAGTQRPAAPAC